MFSRNILIPVILALSMALTAVGCQETSKNLTVSTVKATSEITKNKLISVRTGSTLLASKTTDNEKLYQISKVQFIKAFKQLYSKLSNKDSIEYMDDGFSIPAIDNYSSGNGGKYVFAFSQYDRARGIIIVFKDDGSEYIPIHMEKFNDIVVSTRFLSASVGTTDLFEVVSQDGLGTGRNQQVQIFSIETKIEPDFTESYKMAEVWKYQTIANSVRPVEGTKDTYEYSYNYASYIVIPIYLFPIIGKHDTPTIVVNDTHEIFTAQGDNQKLTSDKKITNTQITYIWNNNLSKFTKRK